MTEPWIWIQWPAVRGDECWAVWRWWRFIRIVLQAFNMSASIRYDKVSLFDNHPQMPCHYDFYYNRHIVSEAYGRYWWSQMRAINTIIWYKYLCLDRSISKWENYSPLGQPFCGTHFQMSTSNKYQKYFATKNYFVPTSPVAVRYKVRTTQIFLMLTWEYEVSKIRS